MTHVKVSPSPSEKGDENANEEEVGEEELYIEDGEEEEVSEEEQEEEEVEVIEEEEVVEEIHYDTKEFISKAFVSENCTLPENIITFDYSFGYDCQRMFNLCVVDQVILIYASGNLIHFFDTSTGKKWYRRCFSGKGIGHITKNPMEPHIAVGEKGRNPLIIIYEWPSFEIVTILKGGTKTAFTFLNYTPDGELLCSQGDYPDYMLTIWNWRKHKIMLRSKAYGQTVFNSRFSLYVPGHLTSSGISHIKFWKINQTFTGLKLLGELGRFGKSEICNIIGFLALPDEKVVSGCEWGNILVWDGGLIRVEVFRRGKNFCHEAPITQLIYNNGDLTTVAMDGCIKVWYYETIELADPPEEERFIEVEPIFELEVGDYYHKAKLLVIVEANPEDPNNHLWYGQDANGGIWKLDLSLSLSAQPPAMVLECHSGKVAAIQASPFSSHLASLGEDGRIFIHDFKQNRTILRKEFLAGGCSLLWLPLAVEESGCVLIGGFTDGVVRVFLVSLIEHAKKIRSPTEEYINLLQATKPHTKSVTVVTINPKNTIVVTGSEDCTIFAYQVAEGKQFIKLIPIGFVPVPGKVTHCTWKPRKEATILVSCDNGSFMEIDLPQEPYDSDITTYHIHSAFIQKQKFVSIKSELRRDKKLQEILLEREAIIENKRKELKESADEAGIEVDETIIEALKEDLEAEEPDLPELYIPEVPNPILFGDYLGPNIWLSMGGYDAGYMYEYAFNVEGPVQYNMIPDGDDIEITSHAYYYNHKYLILGMGDGEIRVVKVDPSNLQELSDYMSLPMHDNNNGTIRQICFNFNYSYMFTCGNDGNIFSFKVFPENDEYKTVYVEGVPSKGFPVEISQDIDDLEFPSLEQTKNRVKFEGNIKDALLYKRELTEVLKSLEKKLEAVLRRNAKLPESQQLLPEELVLDKRIDIDLETFLAKEMESVKFKLAWSLQKSKIQHAKVENYFIKRVQTHAFKVFGINDKDSYVESFRLKSLGPDFEHLKNLVLIKLEEKEAKGRAQAKLFSEEEIVETIARRANPVEGLLKQIMVLCNDYQKNIKLRRLLRKYRQRKDRLEVRRIEWFHMMKKKPNPDKPDPEDVNAIEHAKETVGDYQLKTAQDYKVPKNAKVTTVHVYEELLRTREKIFNLKNDFNNEALRLRVKKQEMIERHERFRVILLDIEKEIPKDKVRNPPKLPSYVEDLEFPEKKFQQTQAGVLEELPKRFKMMYKTDTVKKKEIQFLDQEYEMLLLEKRTQKATETLPKVASKLALMKYAGISGSRDFNDLQQAGKDDNIFTPWEVESKKLRVLKKLFEQDQIIDEMDMNIRDFDVAIVQLNEKKYQLEVELEFLELYLLTLHQEVLILKKFEAAEEEKENKLFDKLKEKRDFQKKMNEINNRVEGRHREIRRCEEEIKNLVTVFHATVADNKFYDFLRRVFKKKYRPPKVKSEDSDSESESESSSSSEEEDAKSLDSKDLGPLRLDESVCPQGCDPVLYEWTFTQRSARHTLELNIMEEKKQIELLKKEYEMIMKKIKLTEAQYLSCQEDLDEYIREKQRNLNEVETVIVLRLNQIQNFVSETEIEKISESILFSSEKLTNLYKRVGELEKETQLERQKHEKNRHHLTRMKVDVNHMKGMIRELNKDIEKSMMRKFGSKIDIDDIEESLLKRLVAEMHGIVKDLEQSFEKKLENAKRQLIEKENNHAKKLQDNTEKYNLLTVLQEEKIKLIEMTQRQNKIICAPSIDEEEQKRDLDRLRSVAAKQQLKIMELRKEIAALKLKGKEKPPKLDNEVSELIQRIMIKGCDGELEEIDEECKEELKGMYEEAQEILKDAKEGQVTAEDTQRMKRITSDIIKKLPYKCQEGVIKRLSQGVIKEERVSKLCAEGIIIQIVKTLNTDSFIEAMAVVKEIVDSIYSQFESVQ